MSKFQDYQAAFTGHIRDPQGASRPRGVPARRMRVYTEIVFNNMESTLASCFPVVRKILGVRRWRRMVRAFLAEHRCATPWFRQIPEEFLRWLQGGTAAAASLPPFLYSLAHYEWVELAVAVADVHDAPAQPDGNLLEERPVLAASLALLEYPYPVQRIAPRYQPSHPDTEPTRLLVFRAADDTVRFIEINAMTARLLQLLQMGETTGRAALEHIAAELQHPDPAAVLDFGSALLADLRRQGVILGSAV